MAELEATGSSIVLYVRVTMSPLASLPGASLRVTGICGRAGTVGPTEVSISFPL